MSDDGTQFYDSKEKPVPQQHNGGHSGQEKPKSLAGSLSTLDIRNTNMPITWKNWITQLKIYLRANGLEQESNSRKVAILLHFIGTEALMVFYSFNIDIDTISFEELVNKFTKYFTPQINITMERHKLFNRRQAAEESIDDYATDLRNIGRQCEFGTLEDSLLRDVFSWNLHSKNQHIKEHILMKKPEKLNDAIELARSIETSKLQAKTLESSNFIGRVHSRPPKSSPSSNRSPSFHRVTRSRPARSPSISSATCGRCGQIHRYKCPAKRVKCKKCGKSNHYASVCRNTQVQQVVIDPEVVYTWEMDFNRSLLSASTLLVPRTTRAPAPAPGMPTWAHNSWVCVFAAMLAVAIGGNAIVIWIVTAHRRMRTVTNYFLVNLSFADLMMASLNCLFNFIYMLHSDWVFGVRYCQLSNFIANVTVAASVFTLTGISFDRYQAIVWPMRPRMSKTCSLITIAVIWVSGMLLAVPCLLYSTTKEYRSKGTLKTACLLNWPDGLPDVSYMDFVYQVLFFVVTYAVPMLGITFFYSAMGRVLWGSRSIGELTQRQIDSIRSKRKVVKMFILVIVIFGICWLPYQSYFIYTHFNPSILYKKYVQHVYLGFYWLAMANAMVNPIIYYWMNAKFRTYFRTAICGWRDALRRRKRPLPDSPPDYLSQSGSRSRSGIEEQRDSRRNVVSEWPLLSCRDRPGPQSSLRPPSFASCPRCPHRPYYDAYIHGRKV